MKVFEEPCFSGNIVSLMFFHTCIITFTNYFSPLPIELNLHFNPVFLIAHII